MKTADETRGRLFLALWPDDSTRRSLLAWRDAWQWPAAAAPVRPAQLHLTLHFLGPVLASGVEVLAQELRRSVRTESFTLAFGRAELWPRGLAVVCPLATPPALLRLHAQIAEALRRLALPLDEKPFRPHVTLARRADHAVVPDAGPALRWPVDQGYALVQSMPGGPRQDYRLLHRFG